MGPCGGDSPELTVVMSWMLDLRLSLFMELRRMKYFCAWLATCVGVRDITKLRDMLLQSPFPYLSSPSRNSLRDSNFGIRVPSFWPGIRIFKPVARSGVRIINRKLRRFAEGSLDCQIGVDEDSVHMKNHEGIYAHERFDGSLSC